MARVDTNSPYRQRARGVIARVLSELPEGFTDAQRRRALRDNYPFAERAGWAYKCWLTECRLALGTPKKPKPPAPAVRVKLSGVNARPWLFVDCGWCGGGIGHGVHAQKVPCMMCVGHWGAVRRVVDNPRWRGLQRQAVSPEVGEDESEASVREATLMAVRDFLDDAGIDYEEVRPKRQKKRGVRDEAQGG